MNYLKRTLTGWGLYPSASSLVCRPERVQELQHVEAPYIPRGYGRCYGDAAQLTDGHVVATERLNRFLAFDPDTGVLRAEAGVSLSEILDVFVPKGWFLPVTPGTKWVSLGGCIAADIHGKNHHVDGSFGRYVLAMEIVLPDGGRVRCSPAQEESLFWATVGGMGLTGTIAEATIQLIRIPSAYISVRNTAAANLDDMFDKLSNTAMDDKYSVAWVDCLAKGSDFGRGIIMNGHHATIEELKDKRTHPFRIKKSKPASIPLFLSRALISPRTIEKFNRLYFTYYGTKLGAEIVDYDRYFYPLDVASNWNRIYGKRGFIQYQFVTPPKASREVCRRVLQMLSDGQYHPYLAVLKRFGPEGNGFLSFPKEGFTLALDIPIKNEGLFPLLDKLDALILQNEGRVYLAKDARLSAAAFKPMYPRLEAWKQVKQRIDRGGSVTSDLARRLQL